MARLTDANVSIAKEIIGRYPRPKSAAALTRSPSSWLGVGHQFDSKPEVSQPARRAPAS